MSQPRLLCGHGGEADAAPVGGFPGWEETHRKQVLPVRAEVAWGMGGAEGRHVTPQLGWLTPGCREHKSLPRQARERQDF